ncbi:MAG: hypothetical protein BGO89_11195 [Candidatus Kapaibacterium thiocyanatum]|uniref:RNA polymerase subunit sigma-24 n=1 Tax=Candidatus Kapaibacterium thiocyanatum TaxID=1895771 RepID=A0A1M3KXD2_9BACT|nr:MAG: hypothetical protein BGO89_11195 ['Candidatus Kapabacteria' thiocyanatum]
MDETYDRQQEFMDLLRPVQARLEKFALNMTRDTDAARDLMQDTILAAWQHFDTLRDHAAFKSYVFTIASNMYKRKFVRAKFFGLYSEELQETLESSTPSPERSTELSLVREALQTLPHKYREALVLFEINGLSVTEIQRVQGGTVSGVKVRLMRARRMLADRLGIHDDLPVPETVPQAFPTTQLL